MNFRNASDPFQGELLWPPKSNSAFPVSCMFCLTHETAAGVKRQSISYNSKVGIRFVPRTFASLNSQFRSEAMCCCHGRRPSD
jgi:hypothetical protein